MDENVNKLKKSNNYQQAYITGASVNRIFHGLY